MIGNPMHRRDALKFGGLTVSLAALVAACGEGRTGDDAPGRVGNAPPATDLPNLPVDDAVLLRTASSLEYTVIDLYQQALELGSVPADLVPMMEAIIDEHRRTAEQMEELTVQAGGEPWTCPNPWAESRLVGPILEAILAPGVVREERNGELVAVTDDNGDLVFEERSQEDIDADVISVVLATEDLAVASHQALAASVSEVEFRLAHVEAATVEARHSSTMILAFGGAERTIAPSLLGEEDARGVRYALPTTFAQTSQIEVLVGAPDENGVIESFALQTPAENSFVYNELTCEA